MTDIYPNWHYFTFLHDVWSWITCIFWISSFYIDVALFVLHKVWIFDPTNNTGPPPDRLVQNLGMLVDAFGARSTSHRTGKIMGEALEARS